MSSVHPPFDPELEAALRAGGDIPPTITADLIPVLREAVKSLVASDEDLRRGGAIDFVDKVVAGSHGAPNLAVLVCRPAGFSGPAPAIYYIHGGGMIAGDNRTGIAGALDWVEQFEVVLVSIEYRLAPEHPHPAPVEDCYAGLVWTADHGDELGIDGTRLLVAGTSAGGGLAAAVALMARDRGGPALVGQVLICPMLDDRNETPSSHELDGEGVWDRASNLTGWTALLGDERGGPGVSAYAAPARASDLFGLPPAFLDVGSVETFRDEVVEYAARIWRAGGDAELHVWPGGFHGFDGLVPDAALSIAAHAVRSDWLRRLLSG